MGVHKAQVHIGSGIASFLRITAKEKCTANTGHSRAGGNLFGVIMLFLPAGSALEITRLFIYKQSYLKLNS
jgi:hypothetical protein